MKNILFLTSNPGKVAEAKTILNKYGVSIIIKPAKGIEIQSDSFSKIARVCAESAYKQIRRPLFVEDSGLFINALNGFPGTYSSTVYRQIGCPGILRLCTGLQNRAASAARAVPARALKRAARFMCAVAYADKKGVKVFEGECHGAISKKEIGLTGFGYDPIFIPEGYGKTFAQLPQVKAKLSHRVKALEAFGSWLENKRK